MAQVKVIVQSDNVENIEDFIKRVSVAASISNVDIIVVQKFDKNQFANKEDYN